MNEKPLILHLCPTAGPLGGIWTYIRHIMESRLADTYRFDVCFYPGPSVGVSPRVIGALRREVQRRAPDLLHLHGLQTEGFNCMMGARLGSRCPRLLTVHGFIEDSKFRTPWRRAVIAHVLEPLTLLGASAVFAVSRYGADKPVMKRWARRLLGCVGNALPDAPDAGTAAAQAFRHAQGWSATDVVAVCVARFSREKGLLDLLDAFELLADRVPELRLLLVGDGPDAGLVRQRVAGSPFGRAVTLHPATGDIAPLLAAADFFVLPSLHENQSFAILEAMAAGLPVLSTRVGGTPELVQDGVTGLLVPPSAPAPLADAMARLAADASLRSRLGRAGREAVRRDHAFAAFLERIDSIYRRMLANGGGRAGRLSCRRGRSKNAMSTLSRFAARLPDRWQQEIKRHRFSWQIRRGAFATAEPEYARLPDLVRPGDWAIDIGANVGHYTKRLSELVGAGGRVIAFEPVPATFALLAANARLFAHPNVTLINAAASDATESVGMTVPGAGAGAANYYQAHLAAADEASFSVIALSIDALGLEHRVALVKIDAEGHEASVLRGLHRLLATHHPVLIVETKDDAVVAHLDALGYRTERLPDSPNLVFTARG